MMETQLLANSNYFQPPLACFDAELSQWKLMNLQLLKKLNPRKQLPMDGGYVDGHVLISIMNQYSFSFFICLYREILAGNLFYYILYFLLNLPSQCLNV